MLLIFPENVLPKSFKRLFLRLILRVHETGKEIGMETEKNSAEIGYMKRLSRPVGPVDVVLDTDAYNEIDDLYALAYMIRSNDRLNVKGIMAAPFYSPASMGRTRQNSSAKEGMEQSYLAIRKLLSVMGETELKDHVFKGAEKNLPDEQTPVDCQAVREIIRLAREHTPEEPLYVVGIAVLTDIASAILLAPDITDKMVVVWLGGHGKEWQSCSDFNAVQDIAAARVVFGCGVAAVQLPCNGVVSEFRISRVELEYYMRGKSKLSDYLLDVSFAFMEQREKKKDWSKPLWDVTAVAWLLDEKFMEDRYEHSPVFEYDNCYGVDLRRHFIKYVYHTNRDILFEDMFAKLAK